MKRKPYTEEKIISMFKQHEGGRTMVELARELQAEKRRLKHHLGEAELDKASMKEIIRVRQHGLIIAYVLKPLT